MFHKRASQALSFLVLTMALALPGVGADSLFKKVKSYPSGGQLTDSIAVADVNADGKPDLIVGSRNFPPSIGVLLGQGDGLFQLESTYDSGGSASSVAVADVNGDGKPDLLVSNLSSQHCSGGDVGVLLGNGNGTFQPVQNYCSGGDRAQTVVAGDVNGDGKLDLIVDNASDGLNPRSAMVTVLLGNGNGTFQPPLTYPTNAFEEDWEGNTVAAADLNKDGKLDIVVALNCLADCANGGFAGVFLGNGNGTFQPLQTYPAGGFYPETVAVGDVNEDGIPDIVIAQHVLLGNGDGTFQPPQPTGIGGHSIALADVNRDGKVDLLVAYECNGACGKAHPAAVALGNGDGTFQSAVRFPSGGSGGEAVAAVDVNGDGKLDMIIANRCVTRNDCAGGGTVGVLLNDTHFATTTALGSSPNPSVQGEAVTFTAVVTSSGWITPTGTVTIKNGTTTIGTPGLKNGVATVTRKNLPVGTLSITATYNGDIQSSKSTSPSVMQVVNSAPGAH